MELSSIVTEIGIIMLSSIKHYPIDETLNTI